MRLSRARSAKAITQPLGATLKAKSPENPQVRSAKAITQPLGSPTWRHLPINLCVQVSKTPERWSTPGTRPAAGHKNNSRQETTNDPQTYSPRQGHVQQQVGDDNQTTWNTKDGKKTAHRSMGRRIGRKSHLRRSTNPEREHDQDVEATRPPVKLRLANFAESHTTSFTANSASKASSQTASRPFSQNPINNNSSLKQVTTDETSILNHMLW